MSMHANTRPSLRGRRAASANSISGMAHCGLLVLPMLLCVSVAQADDCVVPANYDAVQNCIDNVAKPGDTVQIAEGVISLGPDQVISIPDAKLGIKLVGAGIGATVVRGTNSNEVLIEVGQGGGASPVVTVIEGLTLDGPTPTGPVQRGIRVVSNGFSAASPSVIRHCEFHRLNQGVVFSSSLNPRFWMVGPGNVFDYSQTGVNLNQADDITIAGNVFRGYEWAIRSRNTQESINIEILSNVLGGGARSPLPGAYYGVYTSATVSTSGVPKNWRIRDNTITGATWGIRIDPGTQSNSNLSGVEITGNCLDDNTILGSQAPPPPAAADIRNDNALPMHVSAPNNFGGTDIPKPVTAGPVSVVPWLKDIVYTGSTAVVPGDAVILEAIVHNTDGVATGPASGVLVRFFRTPAGGGSTSEVGIGVTDMDGRAVVETGVWDIGTYDIDVKAAGGCVTGQGSVAVRQVSTTVYDGETYATYSATVPVSVSATIWPPASSTITCGGPSAPSPGPVSFVATPIGGGAVVSVPGVHLLLPVPPSRARSTEPVTMTLQPGVYLMSVNYSGGRACLPSSDTAVVVVAGPGDSGSGGGWYRVDGFAPPRANFGFTVQQVMQGEQTAGYKGQLLWMNNNRWRLKGVVDTDAGAYGTFPCPNWTGYAGASDNPVCAAFRGSGLLETWDATSMQWLPATAYGNLGAVTFTATAYDGGSASICKKKACSNGDLADYFGIQIDPVPGSVLPESPPLLLMGGSIKTQ